VVAVGAGGGGKAYNGGGQGPGCGGGGGALAYVNNIVVVPGTAYAVVVGLQGYSYDGSGAKAYDGGNSSFTTTVIAGGGKGGTQSTGGAGGTVITGTGGSGGAGGTKITGPTGGGGAAGYSGTGGVGGTVTNQAAGNGTGGGSGGSGIIILAYTTGTLSATGGIIAMGLVLIPALKRAEIPFTFKPNFSHPAVRTMVKLSSWTFGYVVTNQISLVVIKNLAEPGSGNQDAYSKAFTFFMLPHGLLAISIATTFVPELVRRVRAGDSPGFANWTTSGIRWISILTIPSSIAIVILAQPIISSLLEHGHFNSAAAHNTARALAGFSVGLFGFSVYIFCLRGFYAHEDTRTPFYINVFENGLNIVLALLLVKRHGVLGLGLAFGIAYMVSALVVVWILHRKYQAIVWPSLGSLAWRVSLASTLMGVVLLGMHHVIQPLSVVAELAKVFLCIVAGLIVYIVSLFALQIPEVRHVSGLLPRRNTDIETTLQ
jgi:O-antigen/teichoic acid export membrane protein